MALTPLPDSPKKPKKKRARKPSYFKPDIDFLAAMTRIEMMYDPIAGFARDFDNDGLRTSLMAVAFGYLKQVYTPICILCSTDPTLWLRFNTPAKKPDPEVVGSKFVNEVVSVFYAMQRVIKEKAMDEDVLTELLAMARRVKATSQVCHREEMIVAAEELMRESKFSADVNRPRPRKRVTDERHGPNFTYIEGGRDGE